MLKVDNLTFEVNEEGRKRCLVNHISFEVKDGEMLVITDQTAAENRRWQKYLPALRKQTAEKSSWMRKILPVMILTTAQTPALAMHSSSRRVLKE